MLEFRPTFEPRSLEIRRDRLHIGFLQWYPGKPARMIVEDTDRLSLDEMKEIIAKYESLAAGDLCQDALAA